MSTVVLFNHPGEEHVAVRTGRYPWNVGDHRRKYLEVAANVARREEASFRREPELKRVALWAEFEPDTDGRPFPTAPGRGVPASYHRLLPVGAAPAGGQNTDPWIFGSAFTYGFCRQVARQTAYLRNLVHGDLLLFGSFFKMDANGKESPHFNFFLDTAFVVDVGHPWGRKARIPERLLDPAYERAAASRFPTAERNSCVLYEGVMLEGRSSQPFCFAPCRSSDTAGPVRMKRPLISDLLGFETAYPREVPRFENVDARQIWRQVVDRCISAGCELAVRAENPGVQGVVGRGAATGVC